MYIWFWPTLITRHHIKQAKDLENVFLFPTCIVIRSQAAPTLSKAGLTSMNMAAGGPPGRGMLA